MNLDCGQETKNGDELEKSKKVDLAKSEDVKPRWMDDGPRYNVVIETKDSSPGIRVFRTFFETDDLAAAKKECVEAFDEEGKTTFIMDRAELNALVMRCEKEVAEEPVEIPKRRKRK